MKAATGQQKTAGGRKATERSVTIKCSFCNGTGKDPFELLSKLGNCPVCNGRKIVQVQEPLVACVYCLGTGRQRHRRLTCSACGGKGVSTLAGPTTPCPQCGGTGGERATDLACTLCKGTGLVARRPVVRAGRSGRAVSGRSHARKKQPLPAGTA